jgi:hypothetical protein
MIHKSTSEATWLWCSGQKCGKLVPNPIFVVSAKNRISANSFDSDCNTRVAGAANQTLIIFREQNSLVNRMCYQSIVLITG